MSASGFDGSEEDIAIAAGDNCEIGAYLEPLDSARSLREDDLAFARNRCSHPAKILVGWTRCQARRGFFERVKSVGERLY
jgi:hypothetical protein